MGKNDEYRANAAECQRMADITRNPKDKQTWLEMAQHWLHMITQRKTPTARFDAAVRERGTGQSRSEAEH